MTTLFRFDFVFETAQLHLVRLCYRSMGGREEFKASIWDSVDRWRA